MAQVSHKSCTLRFLAIAVFAAAACFQAAAEQDGGAGTASHINAADADMAIRPTNAVETTKYMPKFGLHAYADIESAYLCRGYIWDVRPYSAQSVDGEIDFGPFGRVDALVWTMSATSSKGTSSRMSRYAYAEIDYLIRYCYDLEITDNWKLTSGVARQWVTNPGFVGGHTVCDIQFMQSLHNPYVTPYWKVRAIHRPFDEAYWIVGAKRGFSLIEDLTFTVDFYGDLGDHRHFVNLYGSTDPDRGYHGGLQALNLVLRLDYSITKNIGIFAFAGQFCLVSEDARAAVKDTKDPEARRDLTFGGAGVSIDF